MEGGVNSVASEDPTGSGHFFEAAILGLAAEKPSPKAVGSQEYPEEERGVCPGVSFYKAGIIVTPISYDCTMQGEGQQLTAIVLLILKCFHYTCLFVCSYTHMCICHNMWV